MIDENNIVGQRESDGSFGGGDSASWQGIRVYLDDELDFDFEVFEVGFGAYVRHPTEGYSTYYKNPWDGRITRDQMTGILAALIKKNDKKALLRAFLHHGCRLWLFDYATRKNGENTGWKKPDLTGPNMWAMYVRGFIKGNKWLSLLAYPLLCLLDIHGWLDAWHTKRTESEHVINFVIRTIISVDIAPTFVSKAAHRVNPLWEIEAKLTKLWCGWRNNCFMKDLYMNKLKRMRHG